jgi:hypothetical protein
MFGGHDGYSPKSLHKWIEENKEVSTISKTANNNNETAARVVEKGTSKQVEEDKLAHVY